MTEQIQINPKVQETLDKIKTIYQTSTKTSIPRVNLITAFKSLNEYLKQQQDIRDKFSQSAQALSELATKNIKDEYHSDTNKIEPTWKGSQEDFYKYQQELAKYDVYKKKLTQFEKLQIETPTTQSPSKIEKFVEKYRRIVPEYLSGGKEFTKKSVEQLYEKDIPKITGEKIRPKLLSSAVSGVASAPYDIASFGLVTIPTTIYDIAAGRYQKDQKRSWINLIKSSATAAGGLALATTLGTKESIKNAITTIRKDPAKTPYYAGYLTSLYATGEISRDLIPKIDVKYASEGSFVDALKKAGLVKKGDKLPAIMSPLEFARLYYKYFKTPFRVVPARPGLPRGGGEALPDVPVSLFTRELYKGQGLKYPELLDIKGADLVRLREKLSEVIGSEAKFAEAVRQPRRYEYILSEWERLLSRYPRRRLYSPEMKYLKIADEWIQILPDGTIKPTTEASFRLLNVKKPFTNVEYYNLGGRGQVLTPNTRNQISWDYFTDIQKDQILKGKFFKESQFIKEGDKIKAIELRPEQDIFVYNIRGLKLYKLTTRMKISPKGRRITREAFITRIPPGRQTSLAEGVGIQRKRISTAKQDLYEYLYSTRDVTYHKFKIKQERINTTFGQKFPFESVNQLTEGKQNLADLKIRTLEQAKLLRNVIRYRMDLKFKNDLTALEPHVANAVRNLNKKGYFTVSSGFTPINWFEQHIVFNGKITPEILNAAKKAKLNVKQIFEDQIEVTADLKNSTLRKIKKQFDIFVDTLPQKTEISTRDIPSRRYQTTRGFSLVEKEPLIEEFESPSGYLVQQYGLKTKVKGPTAREQAITRAALTQIKIPKQRAIPRVKTRITPATSLIPSTSQVITGAYAGLGLYERTEEVTTQLPRVVQSPITNVTLGLLPETMLKEISRSIEIPRQREVQREVTVPREVLVPRTQVIPREVLVPRQQQVPRQALVPRQTLIPRQVLIPRLIQTPQTPQIPQVPRTPRTPTLFGFPSQTEDEINKRKIRGGSWNVEVKRKNKFRTFKRSLPRNVAEKTGADEVLKTLAVTFKLKKSKQKSKIKRDIDYEPDSRIFRDYKIKRNQRIPLKDTWIQKSGSKKEITQPGARLFSIGERKEIQEARKRSKILNYLTQR